MADNEIVENTDNPEMNRVEQTGDKCRYAPFIIVIGNEKGGAGKSTVAMHIAVALMQHGLKIGVIDLDLRQRSLSRYIRNRQAWLKQYDLQLEMPILQVVEASEARNLDDKEQEEFERLDSAINALASEADLILIDTPGTDNFLSRSAHAKAKLIVTPLNDSFVDFDLLGEVDPNSFAVNSPSIYSQMIWECRKMRVAEDRSNIDWLVMRNRMSALEARNQRRIIGGLRALSRKIGFRVAPGLSERVVYRELFPMGLTVLDEADGSAQLGISTGQKAARKEVLALIDSLNLPHIKTSL